MFFRVTNSGMANRALTNAQIQLRRIDRSHRNISTGVRIHRPSDDPLAQRSVLSQRTITNRLEADLSNVTHAKTLMNVGVSRLINIKDVLVQARTIAQDGIQSSERELLGGRIEVIAEQIRESANTLFDGHYMFGGADTLKPPFVDDGAGGFAYQGSEYRTQTVIGVNLSIDVLYSGNEIFQNSARSPTVYQGETGAQPGTATDNGVGRATLTVRHTATSFVAGSGIANGTSATAQNTAIGTFSLQIDDTSGTGANGTISLSGGPPVNFQSTDTDLRLKGPNGEILFLDTTSITPGFSGTIQVTADGTLSVDGGQSEVPITFANNQAVSHAETGTVTYVNSQQIIQAGTEFLDYRGTSDVFATLQFLAEDLANDSLSGSDIESRISNALGDLDRHIDTILRVVGEKSIALEALERTEARIEQVQLQAQETIANIETADIASDIVTMQSAQNLLRITYSTTSDLLQLNLASFL